MIACASPSVISTGRARCLPERWPVAFFGSGGTVGASLSAPCSTHHARKPRR
jgi:hypothetical protein